MLLKTPDIAANLVQPVSMVSKIISGAQTGADRSALDFAIERGILHGGWCPRGGLAEDGSIPEKYALTETPGSDASQRTEWNVRDSDATVIFSIGADLKGGSKLTLEFALEHKKPFLHISRERDGKDSIKKLSDFLARHPIAILNIAGPRASEEPEIRAFVFETLRDVLK